MGHHSSEEQWPYYRSLLGWAVPWMLIAGIVGVAVWVAVDFLGQGELEPPPQRARSAAGTAQRSPSPISSASPTQTPTPVETVTEEPPPEENDGGQGKRPKLIAEGVSVQVLNSTTSPTVSTAMAERLSSLGFDVAAVNPGSGVYPRTTVFWSHPDAQRAAEALAERFGWESGPKPSNLSATVDLHVVIGDDQV